MQRHFSLARETFNSDVNFLVEEADLRGDLDDFWAGGKGLGVS